MNVQDFNNLVEEQFGICRAILETKGKEYAPDEGDRLSAFKTAGSVLHRTPIQALGGQMSKHTISLFEMIENDCTDKDLWLEKLTDQINYLLLLKGLLYDQEAPGAPQTRLLS
jgi:hypothetical protein